MQKLPRKPYLTQFTMHKAYQYVCMCHSSTLGTEPGVAQVVKALTAAETAYSAHSSKGVSDSNLLAGADATLVALVQACLPTSLLPTSSSILFAFQPAVSC